MSLDETTTTTHALQLDPVAPRPRLVVSRSPVNTIVGCSFAIADHELVIGRAGGVDVHIDDSGTSRRHARVVPVPGGFEIEDLESTNGTYVNGRRIKRQRLVEGDRVQVGSLTVLRFTCEADAADGVGRALATAGIGLFEWSMAHQRIVGTDNLTEIIGIPPARLSGRPSELLSLLAAGSRSGVRDAMVRMLAGTGRCELELEVLARGGNRWLMVQAEVLRDQDGAPLFIVGTVLDLTARRRSEVELRRQCEVFESLYDAVVLSETSGRITDWNAAAERTFGLSKVDAVGRQLGELAGPQDPGGLTALMLDEVERAGRWTGEIALDGGRVVLEAITVPLRDGEGHRVAHLTAFRDVTERKRIEGRLLLADRMASVGTLAAGVAHEINNPLAFIRANLGYITDELERLASKAEPEATQELRQVLEETREGARRIELIVRDLKTFSRAEDRGEVEAVNLRTMLGFAVKMVENQVRHRAQLEFDVAPDLWVRGNEARLGQVFVNLLVNAVQAIPEGSTKTHAVRLKAHAHERSVIIEVQDTGSGIPPAVRARLFSPFFTTKRVGEGTGLGLSVSHAIVTALGGEIGVESELGRGSTFRVRLPAALDPAARVPTPPAVVPPKSAARARVLLIDDDRLVASALKRSLSAFHDVTVVSSGADALSLLESAGFDQIVCDVMMPDISGMELHAILADRRPELLPRLAFLTGGAFTPRAQEFVDRVGCPVLRKPCAIAELVSLVERTLQAHGRCRDAARPSSRRTA